MKYSLTPRRSLLLFFLLALGIALYYVVSDQPLDEASPESVGMSTDRLQRIDTVMKEYVEKQLYPGAVVLVMRHGKLVYHKSFGYNDLERKVRLPKDAIVRIASMSKAITSTAVMMLHEEGKFLLDDPVSKYIPAFKQPKVLDTFNAADTTYTTVPASREITIRDLLTHTSGLSYPEIGRVEAIAIYAKHDIPSGIGTPHYKLKDVINRLATLPLMHQPGKRFTYGLNTDVLGFLVEVVSGKPLDQFMRERIFEPLGMKDTGFYLAEDKASRLSTLFAEYDEGGTTLAETGYGFYPNFPLEKSTYYSGGAGLVSTAYDYAIFLQMILNGGEFNGKRVLGPVTVKLMTSNQIGDMNLIYKKFGLGFSIATEREAVRLPPSAGSLDWNGIYGTTFWADPEQGIVAVMMTQKYPNPYVDLGEKFRVLVYQAITQLD
ncbi:serine hydrolase domain-containing protein [Telluribacter humicola]|uniref:serine hydrolase domain-containing protein n=1 Tax=Telluribacter humicola TaxID=1720261 RepID=UPI001A960914|nr:serine hydrolase domain-containing protein [Telluribacter humicola]